MSKTPKPKQEKQVPTATVKKEVNAGDLIADRRAVLAKADEILEHQFTENRPLSFEELDFLQSVVGWDRVKINDSYRRVSRRVRLQQIAGTSKDRDELKQFSEAAQTEFETRAPTIDEQIAALTAERNKLEKTASTSARRFEETQNALQQLTEVCSPSVQAEVSAKVSAIKSSWGSDIADLRIELQQIKSILAGPDSQRNGLYWGSLKTFDSSLMVETVVNNMLSYSYSPAWPAVRADLMESLEGRQVEIDRLQKLLDEALAEARKPLEQYWR